MGTVNFGFLIRRMRGWSNSMVFKLFFSLQIRTHREAPYLKQATVGPSE